MSGKLTGLVIHTARDITDLTRAYDAERLVSTLLGAVYAALPPDRSLALDRFVEDLRADLAGSDEPYAPAVAAVLAALTGAPVDPTGLPDWAARLDAVTPTGTYAFGDRYGDQTSYVATFDRPGEPSHAVIVLVDHNADGVKEIFVASPAEPLVDRLRDEVATSSDEMAWFTAIEPTTVRAAITAYIGATDTAETLPEGDAYAENRLFALARVARLAAPPPPPPATADSATVDARDALATVFLASAEAELADLASTTGAARDALTYCLSLVIGFGTARGDALRWSPAAVETFLGAWVHERALLDARDVKLLPTVLRAWITWAGRRVDLPADAVAKTVAQVRAVRPEFERLAASGERRTPAADALSRMLAEGVNLDDDGAIEAWISANLPTG